MIIPGMATSPVKLSPLVPDSPQPAPDHSKVDMVALHTPEHPHHLFSVGQIVSLGLLALTAYNQQNKPGAGPVIFTDPAVLAPYLRGILSVFAKNPDAAA